MDKYEKLIEELDIKQRSLGLPPKSDFSHNEATELLEVTREKIRGMDALECQEGAILLQQFSFHLQRWQSRCQAVSTWAEQAIRYVIANEVSKVFGYSPEERKLIAIKASKLATDLNAIKVKADILANDIAYLTNRVESQAHFFSDLAKMKVKQHG